MGRKVSVVLDLDAAAYLAKEKAVEKATKSADDQFKALGRQTDATSRDMDELAVQAAVAKSEVDDLGDQARQTSAELKVLDGSLGHLGGTSDDTAFSLGDLNKSSKTSQESIRDMAKRSAELAAALKALDARIAATKASVRELGIEFASTGDKATGKELGSQRSLLGRLLKVQGELTSAGASAGSAFSKGFDSAISAIGPGKGILFGGLIAGAVSAAPLVAGIIGGAVGGGVGTAAIAAGLLSASKDPTVEAAAKEFGAHVSAEFFGPDSHAFVKPAIDSLGILTKAFDGLHLGDSLAKAAPTVTKITTGIADLATNAMPGLNRTLERLGPFADVAAKGFGDLGTAVGGFLDDVTSSPGAIEGLESAFRLLNGTITATGKIIHVLEETYDAFLRTESSAYDNLRKLADATGNTGIAAFADQQHRLYEELTHSDTAAGTLNQRFAVMGDATVTASNYAEDFAAQLSAAQKSTLAFRDALLALESTQLSLDNSTLAWKRDLLDLTQSVKEHGHSIADNTDEGLKNQQMIQGLIGDALRVAQATKESTGSTEQANKVYADQIGVLQALLVKLHFTKAQIDELTGDYRININTTFSYAGYSSKLAALARREDLLDGRFAAGGDPQPGGTYLVGEKGPEILQMGAAGGHVYPSIDSWKSSANQDQGWRGGAAASTSGGGGGNRTITIIVKDTSGRTLRNELIDDAVARNQPGSVISAAYP